MDGMVLGQLILGQGQYDFGAGTVTFWDRYSIVFGTTIVSFWDRDSIVLGTNIV